MKRYLIGLLSVALLIAGSATPGWAKNKSPCMQVRKACIKAGFKRNGQPGKLLWSHCIKPLLAGSSVEGIEIDPEVVTACKDKKAKRRAKAE